jgi:pimeloyl-ACP methyl ester carboxylesterase
MAGAPPIRYAMSDGVHIAYTVFGEGPDLVLAPGFISHQEVAWEQAAVAETFGRLGSFRRVISFDKRGVGLSDPADHPPTLEECIDDLRAVMDAANSQQADLFGISEGGAMAALFAATHPDRTRSLVIYGSYARVLEAPDYPQGVSAAEHA